MRQLLILLMAGMLLACNENDVKRPAIEWKSFGLENHNINQLDIVGNKIIASTSNGLYVQNLSSDEPSWISMGFQGKNIESFVALSDTHWLVSKIIANDQDKSSIHQSTDQGNTWNELENNFGGASNEPLNDFAKDDTENIIYGTGTNVIAKSNDEGNTWQPIYGDWGGFGSGVDVVKLNPHNNDAIWAGGQGAIENGFLLRTTNNGDNWTEWQDLVDNPTVVKSITFHPTGENELLVGFEGALLRTVNGGEQWNTLMDSEENRFFFGADYSDRFTDRIYAAGWLKAFDDPQPLKLFISDDNGSTWRTETSDVEEFGGVIEMLKMPADQSDVFLLGLWKGGVVKVTISD